MVDQRDLLLEQKDRILRNVVSFNPDNLIIDIRLDKGLLDWDNNGAEIWAKFTEFAKEVGEALRPVVAKTEKDLDEYRKSIIISEE